MKFWHIWSLAYRVSLQCAVPIVVVFGLGCLILCYQHVVETISAFAGSPGVPQWSKQTDSLAMKLLAMPPHNITMDTGWHGNTDWFHKYSDVHQVSPLHSIAMETNHHGNKNLSHSYSSIHQLLSPHNITLDTSQHVNKDRYMYNNYSNMPQLSSHNISMDTSSHGNQERLCSNGSIQLFYNPGLSLDDFHIRNSKGSNTSSGVPWISHPKLKRAISFHQYQEHMALLEAFSAIMVKEKIPYIMCDGTLLGSYMMHDMIPWDNDLDVMVSWKEMKKTLNVFRRITKENGPYQAMNYQVSRNVDFSYLERNISFSDKVFHKFKFFRTSSNIAGKHLWRWPFIDVKFFGENSTHVWPVDFETQKFYTSRRGFYPLHLRPFGNLWLPAPADTRTFLKDKFRRFWCRSSRWNHKKETDQKSVLVSCKSIIPYYPLVHRTPFKNGAREILKLANHTIQCLFVNETLINQSDYTRNSLYL